MFDRVHMQSQSFQMIFQSLMTSYLTGTTSSTKVLPHGVHFHWGTKYPDNPDEILTKNGPISWHFRHYIGLIIDIRHVTHGVQRGQKSPQRKSVPPNPQGHLSNELMSVPPNHQPLCSTMVGENFEICIPQMPVFDLKCTFQLRFHEDDRVSKRDRTGREWIEISEISWHHPDTMKEEMQNILILGFLDHLLPIYPDNPDKNSTSSKYPDLPVRILTSGHHEATE